MPARGVLVRSVRAVNRLAARAACKFRTDAREAKAPPAQPAEQAVVAQGGVSAGILYKGAVPTMTETTISKGTAGAAGVGGVAGKDGIAGQSKNTLAVN